jgi:N-terminal acetyltransferase B complex non-catalytic subunit
MNMLTFVKRDRNWLEFLSVLDATLPRQVSSSHSEQSRQDVEPKVNHSRALFSKIAEEDGLKDRSGFLALLELEKRSIAHGLSKGGSHPTFSSVIFLISMSDSSQMATLVQQYFERFGGKACCFEDLKPYLTFGTEDLVKWMSFLAAVPTSFVSKCAVDNVGHSHEVFFRLLFQNYVDS